MTDSYDYDALVVGGGVTGCAVAKELAPDHNILVIEKNQVAGNASGKASGMIAYQHLSIADVDTAKYAMEFFRDYDGTGHFSFTERPLVQLVATGGEANARKRATAFADTGFRVSYLDENAIERRYTDVFDLSGFTGGVEARGTGWVDPYTLTVTYKDTAEDHGASIRTGVTVTDVIVDSGAVQGVETDAGTVTAPTVVCATGWETRRLLRDVLEVPVRPFRYQTVNLETKREFDESYPMAADPKTGLYWRPEHNGDLHVGGGTYLVDNPGGVRVSVTSEFRRQTAITIPDRLHGLADARITSEDTCPTGDAATPDKLPIIDAPANAPTGLLIATGFHGNGIAASPVAGRAIRSLVTGEACPFSLSAFNLDRFDSRSAAFELRDSPPGEMP